MKRRMKNTVALLITLVLAVPLLLYWSANECVLYIADWVNRWRWPEKLANVVDRLRDWAAA